MRLAVINIKGGVGKTTTAVYLALALAKRGRTLLVDADPEQSSALAWSEGAGEEWPAACTVIPWATRDLARRVAGVSADYDHVVIDSSPKSPLMARQAMSVTDGTVVPVAPSPMEVADLPATLDLADEAGAAAWVLLVKVRARTRSSLGVREMLVNRRLPMIKAEVPLAEEYSMSYGTMPARLGAYADVLTELDGLVKGA